ncbi:MAG: 23S rRNA (uracil(1939)-C(5))-methyltransferase RlmD [Candidatus Saganbacteria bacterium]|nr:23S rRNA (uracil(1939)-C(5))-methyltransferase RlmD [Candidatus Saganbacteria bacterium]
MDFILASQSPRRKELLKKVVSEFLICPSSVDETKIDKTDPVEFAVEAAIAKAKDVAEKHPSSIILGADTVVSVDRRILGKPKDIDDARKTLKLLSGAKHKVITGIALYKKDQDKLMSDYEITYTEFNNLSDKDIEEYLATGDYADKAGSYAIQETGDKFVKRIDGCYDNVVGLPVTRLRKLLNKFNRPELSVVISGVALPNNYGVAKADGKTYFVPGSQVGSSVVIREAKRKKGVQFADLVKVEKESPFAEKPQCPHFGTCGGCIFQNIKYEKQLELKEKYLKHTLKTIGKIEPDYPLSPITYPLNYYYRNKMEFAFGEKDGKIILGLRERSHPLKKYNRRAVELKQCEIFSPIVKKIFPIFLDFANKHNLSVFSTTTHKGILRHLIIREGKNTGEVMLILVTTKNKLPDLQELKLPPEVKSFYWVRNNQISDVVRFEEMELISGEKHITDSIGEKKYNTYPQTFFQPNTKCAELLYNKIKEFAGLTGQEKILGLYCGAGSIEIFLADLAKEVVGIDSVHENIKTAKENAKLNNLTNCAFFEGDVEKVLKEKVFSADILIIDPPRGGISNKAMQLILGLKIPKMIYVSCNPATLARDLATLQENRYAIKEIAALDMFPHTAHLETVVVLSNSPYPLKIT